MKICKAKFSEWAIFFILSHIFLLTVKQEEGLILNIYEK